MGSNARKKAKAKKTKSKKRHAAPEVTPSRAIPPFWDELAAAEEMVSKAGRYIRNSDLPDLVKQLKKLQFMGGLTESSPAIEEMEIPDDLSLGDLYHELRRLDPLSRRDGRVHRQVEKSELQLELHCLDIDYHHITLDGEALDGEALDDCRPSLDDLKRQLDVWNRADSMLQEYRNKLHHAINILSRPHLRPIHILDMPDEVLVEIFGWVKGRIFFEGLLSIYNQNVHEIKNLRLTCRRFCSTSSHLLLPFIGVEMNTPSLSHFEEISRHPLISKGVKGVNVILHFYGSVLADDDVSQFAYYHVDVLSEITAMAKRGGPKLWGVPESIFIKAIKKGMAIQGSWEDMGDGIPDYPANEEDFSHRMALRRGHAEYKRLFADQERLRENDTFVRAVAAAFARMPFAKRLEVHDREFEGRGCCYFSQDNDDAIYEQLIKRMLFPESWGRDVSRWAQNEEIGQPPVDVLPKLICAIHKAGVSLTGLKIDVSPPADISPLAPSTDDLRELKAATQKLKKFNFQIRDWPRDNITLAREAQDIKRFLMTVLSSQDIEEVTLRPISHPLQGEPSSNSPSLGSIISQNPWPKLRTLSLSSMPLHLAELERFVEQRVTPMTYMSMEGIHLFSGTWAEALDVLRCGKDLLGKRCLSLDNPSGGECEGFSEEELEAVFKKSDDHSGWQGNEAEEYIRGYAKENPLRKPVTEDTPTNA